MGRKGVRVSNKAKELNQWDRAEKSPIQNLNPAAIQDEDLSIQQNEVLKYWFLLETSMVEAIQKGNLSLIPVANRRISYLKGAIQPSLLKEGLDGEEEALWQIHRTLFNNGWWERAMNLRMDSKADGQEGTDPVLNFIFANAKFVHPNTMPRVQEGDLDGIRMALNQIHYESLRQSREGIPACQGQSRSTLRKNGSKFDSMEVVKQFIWGYKHLIEPSVLEAALSNDDKALSLVLGQIHHKTLPKDDSRSECAKSFKDVLESTHKVALGGLSYRVRVIEVALDDTCLNILLGEHKDCDETGNYSDYATGNNGYNVGSITNVDMEDHEHISIASDPASDKISEVNNVTSQEDEEEEGSLINPTTPRDEVLNHSPLHSPRVEVLNSSPIKSPRDEILDLGMKSEQSFLLI
ncbi:hypothetical protein ACET3Z_017976 [Daucus carota]